MSEKQATNITEHTYPHNSGGEVSNESLANDFAAHPEEYHPALHRHIGTFLESHGYLREAIQRSEEDRALRQEVRTQRQLTAEEIYGQLKEDEDVEFGNYQAKTFIAKFGIDDFRYNLHRFKELDESVLAQLADNGYILGISGCVQSFSPHLLPTIAELIINSRYGFRIAELLSEFPEDSALIGVVRENIDHVDSYAIYQFIDKFPEINQTNLVLRLINEGYDGPIARICDELLDIDKALLFECLVEEEDYVNIVTLRNFFGEEIMQQLVDKVGELEVNATFLKLDLPLPEGEDINAVLAMLIERRELSLAARTMRRYEGIDQHILEKMIEQGRYDVLQYVSNVTSLNKRNLLVSALSAGTSAVYEVLSLGGFSEEDAKLLITEGYEDSILSSNDAFSELSDDIIETLFQICEPHVICASNLLRTRARPRWMYALLQSGLNLIAPRLRESSAEDIVELQDMLEATGDLGLLASSIHCLPPEVTERVIDRTLGDDLAREAILSRASLLDENARNTLLEKIAELGTTNALVDLLQYRRHFTRIPVDKDMATDLMASGHAAQVVDNLDLFPDVDAEAAMKLCFEEGHYSAFVRHLNLIGSLSREQVELLEDHGYLSTLLTNVRLIDSQTRKDIIGGMLKEGRVSEIPAELYRYIDGSMVLDVVEEYINDSADSFQIFRDIVLGLSPGKQPEGMRAAAKIFGNSFNQNCLQTVHDILNGGSLPRSANELGIYASGQEGLEQLRLKIGDFVSHLRGIHLDSDTENKIMSNPLYFEAFKSVIKYDTSEHLYNMTDDNLRRRISNALTAIQSDNFVPLNPEYVTSIPYAISTLDELRQRDEWTPDVRERYDVLYSDIRDALANNESSRSYQELFEGLNEQAGLILARLEGSIATVEQELHSDDGEGQTSLTRKLDNLRRKRDELASYIDRVNGGSKGQKRFILNDPEAFTNAFSALYPYEELHETMRKVAFTWALRKNRYSSHKLRSLTPTPSIDSVSKIHDFVDHIVNDKTYGELFVGNKKKKVTSEFRKLCSTRALEEAMLRHQENATRKSKEELQFIPTRGLLLEFSGDISDTCWTDKYDSIGSRMPNMTSIIMKRNPGQPTERLVGAAFLIETVDADTNEPVLVLRGVNPIESYINKVSVEEFYKAVTDYTKKIAAKRGMKPAIVIDDHSGGSSSNRPVLYSYHESLIQEDRDMPPLKKVVVRDDDTYFNGYDITTDTYAIA